MTPERFLAIARDALCLILGVGGIAHQEITGQAIESLLLVYTALLGVPGFLGLVSLRRTGETSTTEQSSQSQHRRQSEV